MKLKISTRRLVLAAILSALIVVMTVVPYTGYINYGLHIEITTLHIVVILAAVCLGWGYGAFVGGVWGVSCLIRALANPLWAPFLNPLISVVPRIAVGIVAGLVFAGMFKLTKNRYVSALISVVLGTLTNTVLVLTALNFFGGDVAKGFYETFGVIIKTLVSVNGLIELVAAAVIVPLVYSRIYRLTSTSGYIV